MAEAIEKTPIEGGDRDSRLEALPSAIDDAGAIPKGTIDPVYEAKARVLNHAVSTPSEKRSVQEQA
jgi:hypothetical protein